MKQAKTRTRDKLTRAMEHLNGEKLSYEQQDVADRQARFILYATMERYGMRPPRTSAGTTAVWKTNRQLL